MWQASVDELFGQLGQELAPRLAELASVEPAARIREAMAAFTMVVSRDTRLHRFLIRHDDHISPRLRWVVDRHLRGFIETLVQYTAEAQAVGALPASDPFEMLYVMLGAAANLPALAPAYELLTGRDTLTPEMIDTHRETLLRLLFRHGPAAA